MREELVTRRNIIIVALIVLALVLLILPMNIPFSVSVIGKVVSGQQWLLARQADGSVISTLYDYAADVTHSYTAYQVDRGDVFHFKMHPGLNNNAQISSGDTVGYLFSNMLYQDLNRLEGGLEVAKTNLGVVSSGEKETIINEARDQFLLNQERSQVQNKILERQTKLYQDALVSREDYEITRGMTRIYELETQVAEAHLKTLQTGEKPEIMAHARTQIAAAENELQALYRRLSALTLTAPLTGTNYMIASPDTLLIVADEVRVVLMTIPWQYAGEIDTNHSFSIQPVFSGAELQGKIIKKSGYMRLIGAQQVFIASGILDNKSSGLPINMMVQCSITDIKRSVWDYVLQFLNALV